MSHKPAPKAVDRTEDSHTIRAIRPPFRYADDSSHSLATVETREVTVCLTSSAVVKPENKVKKQQTFLKIKLKSSNKQTNFDLIRYQYKLSDIKMVFIKTNSKHAHRLISRAVKNSF